MNTTEPITPPHAPSASEPETDARRDARPCAAELPTFDEMLEESLPLVGVVAVYGPPVVVVGAFLLLALMLFPPFALLVTLVVALGAAAIPIALTGALLATPYVLVRHPRQQP